MPSLAPMGADSVSCIDFGSLSALATKRLTRHICVSDNAARKHAGQPDAIRNFPVTLPRFVIGNAFPFHQLRRTRIHAGSDRRFFLPGESVANRAMLAVQLMKPTAAAAAELVRKADGRAQNEGR